MIPSEAIACIIPFPPGAKAPRPHHLSVCEMQLWLLRWKNMSKVSFCSRKKSIPKLWGGEGLNIYLVIQYMSKFRFAFFIVFAIY
jgi:hypothetical protein